MATSIRKLDQDPTTASFFTRAGTCGRKSYTVKLLDWIRAPRKSLPTIIGSPLKQFMRLSNIASRTKIYYARSGIGPWKGFARAVWTSLLWRLRITNLNHEDLPRRQHNGRTAGDPTQKGWPWRGSTIGRVNQWRAGSQSFDICHQPGAEC